VALYYAGFCVLFALVSLPLDFYSGYVLEHSFGLSNQTLMGWIKEEAKGAGLAFALSLPMVEVIYFLLRNYPAYWWVWAGVVFTLFSVVIVRLAPVIILPLFYKSTPIEDASLKEAIIPLAREAGVELAGVYKINMSKDTKKANAMLAGLGSTRRVILGDTLLEAFSTEEVQVVFAHELGHHVHRHIWKFIAMGTLCGFMALGLCDYFLKRLVPVFGLEHLYDVAGFPLLLLVMGAFAMMVLPIENAYSRYVEGQSDLYALDKTRNPMAFVSVMNKLADQNLADKDPGNLIEYLFYDHPSISKRIKMAEEWKRGHSFA
jgi:STE24 endopeptidase